MIFIFSLMGSTCYQWVKPIKLTKVKIATYQTSYYATPSRFGSQRSKRRFGLILSRIVATWISQFVARSSLITMVLMKVPTNLELFMQNNFFDIISIMILHGLSNTYPYLFFHAHFKFCLKIVIGRYFAD